MACIRPGIASAGGSFPQDSLEQHNRCARRDVLLWCLSPVLFRSFAGQLEAVVLVRST